MLKSLYISSFVIIDEVQIDFNEGMSVLTGETGAGKSIIVDAIGQLLGNRANSQFIKKGAKKAVIEGIFEIDEKLEDLCEQFHIHTEDEIVITKEIYMNSKSTIKVNYHTLSLTALRSIAPYLMDIHSQFETQSLFSLKKHIHLLDDYAGASLQTLKEDYQKDYNHYRELEKQLDQVIHEDLSDEQIEYYQSQIAEIEEVPYSDEEVEEFETELKRLENYEKMSESIQSFDDLMSDAIDNLDESIYELSKIDDDEFSQYHDELYNYYYDIKDVYESVMDSYSALQFDEYRFNELQDILFKVNRIKRKYGYSMADVMSAKEDILGKIEMINHRDDYINDLQKQLSDVKKQCKQKAQALHNLRLEKARELEKAMRVELNDLYLENAIFHVAIESCELNRDGGDHVTLMISTNKGQSLTPLNETASGGEISRIMLAIKTIIFKKSEVDTIIFDEVDSGVSGKVANAIGEKMLSLAKAKQVIVITHLPQVAAKANYHYSISKETTDEETISSIELLDDQGRIKEIAKMLSGEHVSWEAINNAKILLNL